MSRWVFLAWLLLCPPTFAADASLEAAVDGMVAAQFAEHDLMGVTVSVVQGPRLLLAKGYGVADREEGIAVDPMRTMFRIGSISKVLVWLGVYQQIELGKLDLDTDVNNYLDGFEIPPRAGQGLTLRQIMTHSSGFEDKLIGLYAVGPRKTGTLQPDLVNYRPKRVDPAGESVAYSNYATALAARMVEVASGLSWDDYVDRNLLPLLNMHQTTSRQPVAADDRSQLATGYVDEGAGLVVRPFEYIRFGPVGGVSASATDVANLMTALLAQDDDDVIGAASKRLMLSRAVGDERINGMTLGLYEQTLSGVRAIGHGGSTDAFHSRMVLWPGRDLGLFVSYNTSTGAPVADRFIEAFARHQGLAGDPLVAKPVERERAFAGSYTTMRRPQSTPGRLYTLLNVVRVEPAGSDLVRISTPSKTGVYGELGPGLFGRVGRHERVLIEGRKLRFHSTPMITYERLPMWLLPTFQFGFVVFVLVLNALVILVWPWSSLRRRGEGSQKGQRLAVLVSLSAAIVAFWFVADLGEVLDNSTALLRGETEALTRARWIPVGLGLVALLQLVAAYHSWARRYWWTARRLHLSLLAIANSSFVAWCWYWRLLPEGLLASL